MVVDQHVAFYHPIKKEIHTGIILKKEGDKYQIAYKVGKEKLVAFIATVYIIPF